MSKPPVVLILTAFNEAYRPLAQLSMESIASYVKRTKADFTYKVIPEDYNRPASWFKVGFIKESLQYADYVLWVDADAMLIDQGRIDDILRPVTLNISEDENGINCGIQCWRRCHQSTEALTRIDSLYEEFKDHKWWEQAALQTFIDELDVYYQPKRIFNAYTSDFCPQTRIVHFPGFKFEERLILMSAIDIGIKRNGHGTNIKHS